ncbi:DUF494 domain-containing protein [Neisseriaceae bacterium TC5R-5]|nr:DUF494 domain-containing protein [Neisseriaceae bacterium TC5R-5]
MFDVLAFLLEQYRASDVLSNRGPLKRQLISTGFENEEIQDAFAWLESICASSSHNQADLAEGMRLYAAAEQKHLAVEIRGFIQFLEDHGALSPLQREIVLDKLMALPQEEVNIDHTKLITLLVLWTQQVELPILLGEALLDAVHGEPTLQ